MTQEEVLILLHNKEEKGYTMMYDMYAKSLFAVISNLIKDREEAEDVQTKLGGAGIEANLVRVER